MQAVLQQPKLSIVANALLLTVLYTDWTNASPLKPTFGQVESESD